MLTEAEVRKQLEEVEQKYASILKAGMTTDGKRFDKPGLVFNLADVTLDQDGQDKISKMAQSVKSMMGWASGNAELVLCRNTINLLRIILEIPERV